MIEVDKINSKEISDVAIEYLKPLLKKDIESIITRDAVGLIKEGFWWEFYAWCIKRNLDIVEIPIKHFNRKYDNTVVFKLKKYQ